MPKKADESLKTEGGTYLKQLEASGRYDKNKVDQVKLRVPAGKREKIQKHVDTLPQYAIQGKQHHSVNAYIVDLIKKDMGDSWDD